MPGTSGSINAPAPTKNSSQRYRARSVARCTSSKVPMKAAIATMLHVACRPDRRSSRRVIITKPMPCRRAANGSSVPSAPRATRRTTMCAHINRPSRMPTKKMIPGGISAFVPRAVIV
jgi:hypothetical protein